MENPREMVYSDNKNRKTASGCPPVANVKNIASKKEDTVSLKIFFLE
jgi:hypothetical protein